MKKYFIPLITVLFVTGQACKKDKEEQPPPDPVLKKRVMVTTVAGDGVAGFAEGPVVTARFNLPLDVAVGTDGTVYVADALNRRIRKIAANQVSTFAGTGTAGTINGTREAAQFLLPSRVFIDNTGNLYTLDASHPLIRKTTPDAFTAVFAGTAPGGFKDGAAVIAQFGQSFGITTDAQGNMYIGDTENRRIRRIENSAAGLVTTIAGNGQPGFVNGKSDTAQFFFPTGVVVDHQGNVFVADQYYIRKITPAGVVSFFTGSNTAGFADGLPGEAKFELIEDLVADRAGTIYASDNNRIRMISPDGMVTTIAGGEAGFADGDGTAARFNIVQGLGIDQQGNIYAADVNNYRIRKISFE